MEFNLELAINAGLAGLKVHEIPIVLAPRKGESKLRTFRDGWRSLRMMLLYSPNQLFFVPGRDAAGARPAAYTGGAARAAALRRAAGGRGDRVFATIFSVVGFEILSLGLHAKTYSWSRRFDRDNRALAAFYRASSWRPGCCWAPGSCCPAARILAAIVVEWVRSDLLPLPHPEWVSFAATLVIIGCSTLFSSLFISAMSMSRPQDAA